MERDKLQSKVEKESIPRVEFMGFTNPIPYYQRSKIFWMTSKFEGWGLTLANNTELLDQMSNSAFEKAKSFEIENIMEKWKKLLGISFES